MTSAFPTFASSSAMRPSMKPCFSRAAWYSAFSERSPCARASAMALVMAWRSTRLRRSSSSRSRSKPGRVIGVRCTDMPSPNLQLLVVLDARPLERPPPLLPGLRLLALALNGWLLVVHSPLHLLEEPPFEHHLLEGLQGGFDLVTGDLDFRACQACHWSG